MTRHYGTPTKNLFPLGMLGLSTFFPAFHDSHDAIAPGGANH